VTFFSVKIYNLGNPETINVNGLGLLFGQPYSDGLSSYSAPHINGSILFIIPVILTLAVIVLQFIKPKTKESQTLSVIELALPLLTILSIFLLKIFFDGTIAALPHYLTGDANNASPDKNVLANIEFGFIVFIILNALILIFAVYGQVKRDPEIMGNFRNIRIIVLTSLLISLGVVGDLIQIPVTGNSLVIRFGFIFMSAIAFLFGPIVAFASGMIINTISFMINPGGYAFDIRFTIVAGLAGILYSIFLYKRDPNSRFFIINILLAKISINFIINIVLNTILMRGYFGNAATIITITRVYKNVIMLPVEMLIMFFVLKAVSKAAVNLKFIKPRNKPAVVPKMRKEE